jgi:hypothetical protein
VRHVVLGRDELAGLVELPHAVAFALPDGQVATTRQVPSSRRYASQEIFSMSTPCWLSRASTTSASVAPLSEVLSRVRRACWASIARSCSTGPA